MLGPAQPGLGDVATPLAGLVMEERDRGCGPNVPIAQRREIDDRVFQALARMDRHQLNCRGIAVKASGPLRAPAIPGPGDLVAQPTHQRHHPQALGQRDLVQHLGDVAQVGQLPLPIDEAEHPCGETVGVRGFEHGCDAPRPHHVRPSAQLLGEGIGEVFSAGV